MINVQLTDLLQSGGSPLTRISAQVEKEILHEVNDSINEIREHVAEGEIRVYEAPQRFGKTLMGCVESLDAYQRRQTVYSTIKFAFPFQPLDFAKMKLQNEDNPLRNGHAFIDELNMFLDARASMSKVNRDFCNFLLQVKKQGLTLTGTTHNLSYLDKRFRENYDFKIQTEVFPKFPETPIILRAKIISGPTQKYRVKRIKFRVKPFLGLYDTSHVFNPFDNMATEELTTKKLRKLEKEINSDLKKSKKVKIVEPRIDGLPSFQL